MALSPRSGLKSAGMNAEYSRDWAELRRLRRQLIEWAALTFAVFAGLECAVGMLHVARWIGQVFLFAWLALLVKLSLIVSAYALWPCLRCGKPFHCRLRLGSAKPLVVLFLVPTLARRNCVHCGLPKWTDANPAPTPKRELVNADPKGP